MTRTLLALASLLSASTTPALPDDEARNYRPSPQELFHWACKENHPSILRAMFAKNPPLKFDPADKNSYAIQYACWKGHLEVFRLLLNDGRADPTAQYNAALRNAIFDGHLEVFRLFLNDERVDADYKDTLQYAIRKGGRLEVVRLVLDDERVDPAARTFALACAIEEGQQEVIDLLLKDPRVNPHGRDLTLDRCQVRDLLGREKAAKVLRNYFLNKNLIEIHHYFSTVLLSWGAK